MSIEALQWVMKLGPQIGDHTFRVLIALADCHSSKRGSFPSVAHLEEVTGKSRASIFRVMNELEADGLISRQGRSSGAGRLSNIYILHMDHDVVTSHERDPRDSEPTSHPRDVGGSTQSLTHETPNVSPVGRVKSHSRDGEPELNLKVNLKEKLDTNVSPKNGEILTLTSHEEKSPYSALFEQWWEEYPRRQGKGAAFKAFEKQRKKFGDVILFSALAEQLPELKRAATRERGKNFCPHPATWLSSERFNDPAHQRKKSTLELLQEEYDRDGARQISGPS